MRFYKKTIPDKNDIVYVKTLSNNGEIFSVHILDYNNLEGFIPLNEMTRRTKNKQYKTIGLEYPAIVISNNNGIMLSKTKVPKMELDSHTLKYSIALKLRYYGTILNEFYKNYYNLTDDNNSYNDVMTYFIWKYYDDITSEYLTDDDYTHITENFVDLLDTDFFTTDFITCFTKFIHHHTQLEPYKIQTTLNIICYASDAISEIKKVFNIDDTTVETKLLTSPYFSITMEGTDKDIIDNRLDEYIKKIKLNVNKDHTKFSIYKDKEIIRNKKILIISLTPTNVSKWLSQHHQ